MYFFNKKLKYNFLLKKRLKKRGTEDEKNMEIRIINGKKEIQFAEELGIFKYFINDNLENCYSQILDEINQYLSVKK